MFEKLLFPLEKKIFKDIVLLEIILFIFGFLISTIIIILYFSLIPQNEVSSFKYYFWPLLIWFDVCFGIVAAIALAKKWKFAWILLIFDALLYGAGLIPGGLYALVFVNIIIIPLLLALSSYTWNYKKKYNQENTCYIEIKTMSKKEWFFSFIGSIIFIIVSSVLIIKFSDLSNSIWAIIYTIIGALLASIVMCAMFLSSLRYKGTFVLFVISNSIKMPFFILVTIFFIAKPEPNFLMMTLFLMYSLLAIIYFVNSLCGLYIWSKKEELLNKNRT